MLDIKLIQKEIDYVIDKLKSRNVDETLLRNLSSIVKQRNLLLVEQSKLSEQKNIISKELPKSKDKTQLLEQANQIKKQIQEVETKIKVYQDQLDQLLPAIPNLPLDQVPVGQDETDNVIVEKYENLGRGLVKKLKPHYEIAIEKNLIDFPRAAKLSGSRFVFFKNKAALLVRALENFMLDFHIKNGYEEILPPLLVNSNAVFGTGQLPKFSEDLFKIHDEDLWLIPTAEVPLTNYYNNEIIDLSTPIKFCAYTPCFRSEAGSSGKDTKGLIRSRQFNKVEMVKITNQNDSLKEFELCVQDAQKILELLEIPYQKVLLCSGDLGFSSKITYDLELWLPSEQRFREVSSISYFGDFQSRRAMIRYRNENNKTEYAHTINGSGLAIDRIIAAILEIYQNEDGSIDIPKVLIPFFNGINKL